MHRTTTATKRTKFSDSIVSEVLRLAKYEWFRMNRRPAFIVLCILAELAILVPAVVAVIVLNLDFFSDVGEGEVESIRNALEFSFVPFNAVAMCVGALIFGADFGTGGYRALYTRGASRIAVPLSKVAFIFLILAGLLVIGWTLSLVVSNIATLISDGSIYACTDCVDSVSLTGRALPGVAFWSLLGQDWLTGAGRQRWASVLALDTIFFPASSSPRLRSDSPCNGISTSDRFCTGFLRISWPRSSTPILRTSTTG